MHGLANRGLISRACALVLHKVAPTSEGQRIGGHAWAATGHASGKGGRGGRGSFHGLNMRWRRTRNCAQNKTGAPSSVRLFDGNQSSHLKK